MNLMLHLSHFKQCPEHTPSPVSDAVLSVVAQSVVVRPPPGDSGSGSSTHFASHGNTVAPLALYIADWEEELWGSCRER